MFEAGLFPGVNYYLSCWYKRSEFGIRAAIFFSAAAVAGSFGGLLAWAIERMEGIGGRHGWSWIFIIEGLVTICIALVSFFMVKDFPENATFLSDRNLARVKYRLAMDKQSSAKYEAFDYRYLKSAVTDYKMYLGMLIYMGCDMPLYAFSLFLPSIIAELGYTSANAQMFTIPVYATAATLTIFVGWIADRKGQRGLCNICIAPIGMVGFAMLLIVDNPHLKYLATFLGACGIFPCISNTITWVSNNCEGVYKRGVILGFVIGWGNLNGIVSSNIYQGGPNYFSGHLVCLIYMTVCLFGGSVVLRCLLARENRLRRDGWRDYKILGLTRREQDLLGDQHPEFMYIL
jgi:sugar phosphate permease